MLTHVCIEQRAQCFSYFSCMRITWGTYFKISVFLILNLNLGVTGKYRHFNKLPESKYGTNGPHTQRNTDLNSS